MQPKITTIAEALEDACHVIEAFADMGSLELKQKMAGVVKSYRKLNHKNKKPCKKQQ